MNKKENYRGPNGKILPGLPIDLDQALAKLKKLFAARNVVAAYLFGSYADGSATSTSDIDFAVLLPVDNTSCSELYSGLITDIQQAIDTERFDLLLLNKASPLIQYEVVRSGKIIYARSIEELNDYETKARQKYLDTVYLRKVQNQYLQKRVEQWYSGKKSFLNDSKNLNLY